MATTIDYESAVQILDLINSDSSREIEHTIASALAMVLSRGVGRPTLPLPGDDNTSNPAKFQRFFDLLIAVQAEVKPLPVEAVIKQVDDAIGAFEDRFNAPLEDNEEPEDRIGYREYADEYREMRKLLVDGKISEAIEAHRSMDTFVRGFLYSDDKKIDFQLSIFLDDKGFV